MTAFGCLAQLVSVSGTEIQVFWSFWCFLTAVSWIVACSFVYRVVQTFCHKSDSSDDDVRQRQRQMFALLMTLTNIGISLQASSSLLTCLFWIHLLRGSYVAPQLDYLQDLNECNSDGQNFYTILHTVFGPINGICYDLSCILILITYFYRLYTLFYGSAYQVSILTVRISTILMIIFITISIIRQFFTIAGNVHITLALWNTFLAMYFIMSLCLVWSLRKQAILLEQQTLRNMIGTSQSIPIEMQAQSSGSSHDHCTRTHNYNCNFNSNSNSQLNEKSIRIQGNNAAIVQMYNLRRLFAILILLAYVCIASSLLLNILSFVLFQLFDLFDVDIKYGYIADLTYWTLIFADNLINIACISLQFNKFGYFDCIYNYCCLPCEKRSKLTN